MTTGGIKNLKAFLNEVIDDINEDVETSHEASNQDFVSNTIDKEEFQSLKRELRNSIIGDGDEELMVKGPPEKETASETVKSDFKTVKAEVDEVVFEEVKVSKLGNSSDKGSTPLKAKEEALKDSAKEVDNKDSGGSIDDFKAILTMAVAVILLGILIKLFISE